MNNNTGKSTNPWLVVAICIPSLLMVVLDTTVVDVIIPHMMAALSVDYYDIQWVVIAYMVAAAITMPFFDWLSSRFSYKTLFITGTILFTTASIFCGRAATYYEMIISRIIQGIGEGIVIPTVTSMVFLAFPPEKRGLAMGMIGIGATMGPALGPTLGGYMTEHFSWRWAFYINVPIGYLLAVAAYLFLEDLKTEKKRFPFDFIGFILCTAFLSSFLIAVSKGQEKQWFSSDFILTLFIVAAVSFVLFVIREIKVKHPFLQIKVFGYKDFSLLMLIRLIFGASLYGSFYMIPIYCEKFRFYPTLLTGLIILPGALANGVGVVVSGKLTDKFGGKWLMFIGMILMGLAFHRITLWDDATSKFVIMRDFTLYVLLAGFVFTPLNYMSLSSIPEKYVDTGSSLIHVVRFISGSVGTAFATNRLEAMKELHFTSMSSKVNFSNIAFQQKLLQFKNYLNEITAKKALAAFKLMIKLKSYIFAFQDVMFYFAIACMFAAVFVLILPNRTDATGISRFIE